MTWGAQASAAVGMPGWLELFLLRRRAIGRASVEQGALARATPLAPARMGGGQCSAFDGECRAGQGGAVQVGVHLGVGHQEAVSAHGNAGGRVGSRVGAFGGDGGPGVVVGEPHRGDLVVHGTGDVQRVPSPCDAVGAGERGCGDLADFAGGEGEPVERAAVPVAGDQGLAVGAGGDAVAIGLAGHVVRKAVGHLQGPVSAGGRGVHLGSGDPVDHGAEGVDDVDVPVGGDSRVVDESLLARVGDGVGGDQLPGVRVDEEAPGEGAGDQQPVAVDLARRSRWFSANASRCCT